jgi:hypothetical protein
LTRLLLFLQIRASKSDSINGRVYEENGLDQLEKRVQRLEQGKKSDITLENFALPSFALLALATFCALWARSTRRDPWLWFVAGLVFNIFTLIAIWVRHDDDEKKAKVAEPVPLTDQPGKGRTSSQNIKPA